MALEVQARTSAGDFQLSVAFSVERGSTTAILGPSGSGKTLTLRSIAGLTTPTAGLISIDGRTLFDSSQGINLSPRNRRSGFVFQDYALFPHLTVAANIGYGISGSGEASRERIREIVALLNLTGLESRRPAQLSGGQRQRVALGRALAPDPAFLLLDEPLSALDAPARALLTEHLLELEARVNAPTVLVTHDLTEAYVLAQHLVVLDGGTVLQSGPKSEVFGHPASPRTGELLGVRNLLPGVVASVDDGVTTIDASGITLRVRAQGLSPGEHVTVGARPRDLVGVPASDGNALLTREIDAGVRRTIVLELRNGSKAYVELTQETARKVGRSVPARWRLSLIAGSGLVWRATGELAAWDAAVPKQDEPDS